MLKLFFAKFHSNSRLLLEEKPDLMLINGNRHYVTDTEVRNVNEKKKKLNVTEKVVSKLC